MHLRPAQIPAAWQASLLSQGVFRPEERIWNLVDLIMLRSARGGVAACVLVRMRQGVWKGERRGGVVGVTAEKDHEMQALQGVGELRETLC